MSDVQLERVFNAPPEIVFDFVTRPENILLWWGYEGWTMVDTQMDFTRPGPWHSRMLSDEKNNFYISGAVLEVNPPHAVQFTWAWHDDNGARGHESTVTFRLTPEGNGTKFNVIHIGLSDAEAATRHEGGWTAVLARLEKSLPH